MKKRIFAAALGVLMAGGAGCAATPEVSPEASEAEPSDSQEKTEPKPEPKETTPPTVAEEVDLDGPETFLPGELIERPTADLVVEVLEERDVIATSYDADYRPREGERLWYVDITWTNNLPEVVRKECFGPYSMAVSAYDLQGREMLEVDQPGYITDQECSTGLMQGQTGRWQTAFHSLDEEFGWLVFDDYNGEEAVVIIDPGLQIVYD